MAGRGVFLVLFSRQVMQNEMSDRPSRVPDSCSDLAQSRPSVAPWHFVSCPLASAAERVHVDISNE